jgi:GMP synthase-like glutamine amidotransferase
MPPHALIVDNGSRSAPLIAREATAAGWASTVLALTALPRAGSAGPTGFDAVILSGTGLPVWAPVYRDEIDLIRSSRVPLLGICGGLQLLGRAFGADLEEGPAVIGRTRVSLTAGIPLFTGMPSQVELFQRHIYRLASLPPGWQAIATSADCKLEGIWNPPSGSYGMQAHLEFRAEGRSMLRRFLALAATC